MVRARKWASQNPALAVALGAVRASAGAVAGLAYRSEVRRAADRVRHGKELLEERRRGARDKARLASRLEDFDAARDAIRDAEQLGCPAGQIRMLRGQLELYQGHGEGAIDHLTRAITSGPESVAAWGMLAMAYNATGRTTEYNRALAEATRRRAVTPASRVKPSS